MSPKTHQSNVQFQNARKKMNEKNLTPWNKKPPNITFPEAMFVLTLFVWDAAKGTGKPFLWCPPQPSGEERLRAMWWQETLGADTALWEQNTDGEEQSELGPAPSESVTLPLCETSFQRTLSQLTWKTWSLTQSVPTVFAPISWKRWIIFSS